MKSRFYVHEKGICESSHVGDGTRIWAFAHVLAGARIGRDCNVCDGAFIEGEAVVGDRVTVKNGAMLFDGAVLGDDVFVGPGVVFTNDRNPRAELREGTDHLLETKIASHVTIGANSTIVAGVTVGPWAFIGAGSVVTGDVSERSFAVGNPARHIGWACDCGRRVDRGESCDECGFRPPQSGTDDSRPGGSDG